MDPDTPLNDVKQKYRRVSKGQSTKSPTLNIVLIYVFKYVCQGQTSCPNYCDRGDCLVASPSLVLIFLIYVFTLCM